MAHEAWDNWEFGTMGTFQGTVTKVELFERREIEPRFRPGTRKIVDIVRLWASDLPVRFQLGYADFAATRLIGRLWREVTGQPLPETPAGQETVVPGPHYEVTLPQPQVVRITPHDPAPKTYYELDIRPAQAATSAALPTMLG